LFAASLMSCERREVGYRVAKNGAYLKFIKRYLHYDTSYVLMQTPF